MSIDNLTKENVQTGSKEIYEKESTVSVYVATQGDVPVAFSTMVAEASPIQSKNKNKNKKTQN